MARNVRVTQEQAARLRALAQTLEWSHDAIIGATLDGTITSWNRGARAIYGYDDEEIIGKPVTTLVPPDRAGELHSIFQELRRGRTVENYETIRVTKTRHEVDLSITASPVRDAEGQVIAVTAVCRDITAQKRAEAALHESEEQYRLLFEGNPLPMWVYDHATLRFLAVNEAAVQQYGYSRADFLRMTLREIRPEEDLPAFLQAISQRAPGLSKYGVWRHRRRDGSLIWTEVTSHTLRFNGADAELVMAPDVTERVRSDQQLRQSEERFSKAFRSSPLAISISTEEGRYLDINDAFLQLLGREREEVVGHTASELAVWVDPSDRAKMIAGLHSGTRVARLKGQFRTKAGELRQVRISAERIELGEAPCILAISEDVTEPEKLERQFRQAQRMEAVGRLAGGVAHDFNNILGVILGYSELLEVRLSSDAVGVNYVKEIKNAGQRAIDLTRHLLAFSRQQFMQPTALDLNDVLTGISSMLRRLIREDIDFVISPATGLGTISADRAQIEQILMNLVVNAGDAMPDGGKLVIATANVDLDAAYVEAHPGARQGSYVELSVSDTGTGIGADVLPHIFEPFFTTKPPGRGTGLGLSTVYGIVKQSQGYVWADSTPGKGTTFRVYFPRVHALPSARKPMPTNEAVRRGTETVLLVEDDNVFRELVRQILEQGGYTVLEADRPVAALKVAEQLRDDEIHLLVTDLVMPEGRGQDLARTLQAARPKMKVLLMSGHSRDFVGDTASLASDSSTFIEKPFTPASLLATMRNLLDSPL